MINDISTDKFSESIHNNARIIKDATGTALISFISGDNSILTNLQNADKTARINPHTTASINPSTILVKELKIVCQNSSFLLKIVREWNVSAGAGRNILLFIFAAKSCHMRSQKHTAMNPKPIRFIFVLQLLI